MNHDGIWLLTEIQFIYKFNKIIENALKYFSNSKQ